MPSDISFAANRSSLTSTGDDTVVAAPASDVTASAQSAATTKPSLLTGYLP
jgi:hypothetical protein